MPVNPSKWDKIAVIAELRRLHRQGQDISYGHMNTSRSPLCRAAVAFFGTYAAAVEAAGINYAKIRKLRVWTPQLILEQVRRRHRKRQPLWAGLMAKACRPLYQACLWHFGSYRKAVEQAGLDYATVKYPCHWSARRVLATIRKLHRAGHDLSHNKVRDSHSSLLAGAVRRFGAYRAAIKAAGLDYADVKAVRKWNRRRVIKALRKLKAAGKDLSCTRMKRSHSSLYTATKRYFGTLKKALQAIGLNYKAVMRITKWDQRKVVRQLCALKRKGESLSSRYLREHHSKLGAAIDRLFDGHADALRAAGVDPKSVNPARSWTRQAVLEALRLRHAAGKQLNHTVMRREDSGLLAATERCFDRYRDAVEAAGISYDSVLDRWNKAKVLDELRALHAAGQDMTRACINAKRNGLVQAARKYVGGFYQALDEAGIPQPPRAVPGSRHWTPETICRTLRELDAEGCDLRHRAMKTTHVSLFWAAKDCFGSYVEAVKAAGIDYDAVVAAALGRGRAARCDH